MVFGLLCSLKSWDQLVHSIEYEYICEIWFHSQSQTLLFLHLRKSSTTKTISRNHHEFSTSYTSWWIAKLEYHLLEFYSNQLPLWIRIMVCHEVNPIFCLKICHQCVQTLAESQTKSENEAIKRVMKLWQQYHTFLNAFRIKTKHIYAPIWLAREISSYHIWNSIKIITKSMSTK